MLSRNPRPLKVIFDNASEFKRNSITFLKYFSFKPTCTTINIPQANDILERIHLFFGSMLKAKDMANITLDPVYPWSKILASIAYAMRYSYNEKIQANPEKIIFGSNMILGINFQPNYKEMWQRKQKLINYNNNSESA